MNSLKLSENIIRLRHEKNITQGQLADFIGVTKASVSKWETAQSMPDILTLPVLASFFDITIDELMGYEPNLSMEQIEKLYQVLAEAFAEQPFGEAMEKSRALVKKYYSCYPFLYQVCLLWINHFMLAKDTKTQEEVLNGVTDLCSHIISNCKDIHICNDAIIVKATADLQLGNAAKVIDTLEEILNPCSMVNNCDNILIQSYQMAGQNDKAICFAQISIYRHLLTLMSCSTNYISLQGNNITACEETIKRMETIMSAYDLEKLSPNDTAIFSYNAAIFYCTHQRKEEALEMLSRYALCIDRLFENGSPTLHGDSYFTMLETFLSEQPNIRTEAPRQNKVIIDGAIKALHIPAFDMIKDTAGFRQVIQSIENTGGRL